MAEIKKKRGRKPKNKVEITDQIMTNVNSEDEPIILHLPITINEINSEEKIVDSPIFNKKLELENEDIFIKSNKINKKIETEDSESSLIEIRAKEIISINKINTHKLTFDNDTKCWWCKNKFNHNFVELPEDYYNQTFYCIGIFCSFNCAQAYNIDLNDGLTWKRSSLLNLLYYQTYNVYKDIEPAPHWLILKDFGGSLTIEQFRKSFVVNTTEYTILHPPLISRQMQIEESYKKPSVKSVSMSEINKYYGESGELTLKRSKPIISNQLGLESSMGLKKTKKNLINQ